MDPLSALILASLVTWGTAGGGVKDTAAILKGQSPPSYAYRTAKLAATERERKAAHALIQQAIAKGQPIPPALEPRRIRIKDLMRHWWEDALEDADAWRARRHGSRHERRAARKAWAAKKKSRIQRGYELLKRRGEERFATPEPEEHRIPDQDELPDNVRPFKKREQAPEEEGQGGAGEGPGQDEEPGRERTDSEKLGAALDALDQMPEEKKRQFHEDLKVLAEDRRRREEALGQVVDALEKTRTTNTSSSEESALIDLSDAPTLDAHLRALEAYTVYMRQIAADMDALSAGMRQHQMGEMAVGQVSAAGTANAEAAGFVADVRTLLQQAHTGVADARAASPDAADGDYLTRGR